MHKMLDLKTASEEFCISRRKLWKLISEKRLTAYKLDKKVFVKSEDLYTLVTAKRYKNRVDEIVDETLKELSR